MYSKLQYHPNTGFTLLVGKALENLQEDNCEVMKALYAVYSVPQAAALWCGIKEEDVGEILANAEAISGTGPGRGIFRHPFIGCLEPRTRAITEAIESGDLPHGREDGSPVASGEHVAYERRHIRGRELKSWLEKALPNEKPAFLFDDIERASHTAISADAYRTLKADHDKLASRLKAAEEKSRELRDSKEQIERINQSLEAALEKATVPDGRSKTTYLNIIGAMLKLMLAESPGGQPYSILHSQSAVISALLAHNEGRPGISQRTIEEKFAAANRELTTS